MEYENKYDVFGHYLSLCSVLKEKEEDILNKDKTMDDVQKHSI
jgi:hypothetical protein